MKLHRSVSNAQLPSTWFTVRQPGWQEGMAMHSGFLKGLMKSFVLEPDNELDMKGKQVWHTLLDMPGHLGHRGTP